MPQHITHVLEIIYKFSKIFFVTFCLSNSSWGQPTLPLSVDRPCLTLFQLQFNRRKKNSKEKNQQKKKKYCSIRIFLESWDDRNARTAIVQWAKKQCFLSKNFRVEKTFEKTFERVGDVLAKIHDVVNDSRGTPFLCFIAFL